MVDDFAIVIKALELRAEEQYKNIAELKTYAKSETDEWENLARSIGFSKAPSYSSKEIKNTNLQYHHIENSLSWNTLFEQSKNKLAEYSIKPDDIKLKPVIDTLNKTDLLAAFLIGVVSAFLPSIGPQDNNISKQLNDVQKLADSGKLPGFIQNIFGGNSDLIMDSTKAGGAFHRFIEGHDILSILPEMVSEYGCISGVFRTFQHLLTDSFGRTGIPIPGTNLFGDYIAKILGQKNVTDIISPASLSHYSAFRMDDAVSTGATELLLWGYHKYNKTSECSLKKAQMGIIAHGVTTLAVLIAAHTIPGAAMTLRWRSWVNYTSLTALLKYCWNLNSAIIKLDKENDKDFKKIMNNLSELKALRNDSYNTSKYLFLAANVENSVSLLTNF
ncbi:MAG: hypothetical protein QMC67_13120 [Candidatus Wallbacteria bacterium]